MNSVPDKGPQQKLGACDPLNSGSSPYRGSLAGMSAVVGLLLEGLLVPTVLYAEHLQCHSHELQLLIVAIDMPAHFVWCQWRQSTQKIDHSCRVTGLLHVPHGQVGG